MKLIVRKDIFDSICDTFGIEKAYKYIRRYKKGNDYVYVYPKNVKNKNRTGAKKRTNRACSNNTRFAAII